MKRKRLLCVLLALLLAVRVCWAADLESAPEGEEPASEEETELPTELPDAVPPPAPEPAPEPVPAPAPEPEASPLPAAEAPVIQVQVPDSGRVILNPYGLEIAAGGRTDQIVHEPQALESFTSFPVRVSVQAAGTIRPWSDAYFVSAPPADDALDKQIFLYVEFQNDPYTWSDFYVDGPNQLLVTDWNVGKENVLTLEPFSAGYFRLSGAMAPFPEQMWSSDDAVDVTLAFTFSPAVEEAPLPAEGLDIFAPPVQEPEPSEEPSEEPPEEPSEDVSVEPSEEPSEELPADSPSPDTAEPPVEEPGDLSDTPLDQDSMAPLPDDHAAGTAPLNRPHCGWK